MKRIFVSFIAACVFTGSYAQNVFTYGKNAVTKEEFVKSFNKNPGAITDRKKALKEYLDLYIKFKLKVQAAYDAGLDKDASQQYELQNFKKQVADNIINEEANIKELVKEAFERSQKELRVEQVFIEVAANADTTEACKKIQLAYKQLNEGKAFSDVTAQFSTDELTKQTKGDLGYVTAFSLPYNIENVVYRLKVNSFSAPVKTKIGYHIFKVASERKSLGTLRVAQILIAFPPNAGAGEKSTAARKADSVYTLLSKGADFGNLARQVSNDLSSSNNGGELPEFTTGTYSSNFEAVAFALKNKDEVSKPFETSYGYHILKLIEANPVADNLDDVMTFGSLQDKVTKDNRMEQAKKALIDKKLTLIKYTPASIKEKDLFGFTDSAINKNVKSVKGINSSTVIFSFAGQQVKAGNWLDYVRSALKTNSFLNYQNLYKEFVRASADEYYRNHLENYNASYVRQVQEFKDANLLFAVMEKKVWSKANADTAGLITYYNQHKSKYQWSASADAIIITCNNQKLAEEIQQNLKGGLNNWRSITGNNGTDVVADSGRYELGQLPVIDRTNFTSGLITAPKKNENDGTYTFNYVVKVYPQPSQRSFEDARGMVISNYQQVVEDNWINELKTKYPVKVNETVFTSIK